MGRVNLLLADGGIRITYEERCISGYAGWAEEGSAGLACVLLEKQTSLSKELGFKLQRNPTKLILSLLLQFFGWRIHQIGELEVRSRTSWQVHQQHTIHALSVLVEHQEISEAALAGIAGNLLQRHTLQMSMLYRGRLHTGFGRWQCP